MVDLSVVSIEDTGDLVDPNKFFFFYQSSDGQPIFLHPLDVKILAHEFGSFHDFPPQLVDIPVIQLEDFTQTEVCWSRMLSSPHAGKRSLRCLLQSTGDLFCRSLVPGSSTWSSSP